MYNVVYAALAVDLSFCVQVVQGLQPGEIVFGSSAVSSFYTRLDKPDVLCSVLWVNEAAFTRSGVNHLQNAREWALLNALHFNNKDLASAFG